MAQKKQINSRDFIANSYKRDNKLKFFTLALDVAFGIALIGLCIFLMSMTAYAQNVGINNSAPHTKSLLDLTSNDKGLLTPRMTEVQRTAMFPISDITAKGMLVYQSDNVQGFYYYDGAAWNFIGNSNSGWSIMGNAGTNPTTNFIGTTDAQDVVLKTNNTENLRLTSSGNLGLGTATPTAKMHINSNSITGTQNLKITEYSNDWARIGMYNDSTTNFWEMAARPNNVDSLSNWNVFNSSTGNLLTVLGNGRVGLANSNPIAPLSFNNNIGQKITFYGNSAANYGIGLQGALLQMHTAGVTDDIAFGYGNSAALTENVRFKGNGKIGIGTKTPGAYYSFARMEIANDDGFNSDLVMSTGGDGINKGYPQILFHKSRGTTAAPTVVSNGDWAGTLLGRIYNGTGFETSSGIIFGVDSNVAPGYVRGNIQFITSGGAQSEKMRINKNGNVGIGTTNPTNKLYVQNNDSSYATALLRNTNASGYSGMWFASSNGALQGHFGYGNTTTPYWANKVYAGSISAVPFVLTTWDQERMRIETDGDIGIGTSTPLARLHVYSNSVTGTQNIKAHEAGNDLARIGMYNDSTTKFWEIAAQPHVVDSLASMYFYNSSAGNMLTVKGNGRVGIANSNPLAPLSFNNNIGQKINFWNNGAACYGIGLQGALLQIHTAGVSDDVAFGYGSSTAFTETMRIKGSGDVGIGTSTPTATLEVNGYTKLGTDAPAIKMKKYTGTTPATQGTTISFAHGLNAAKILDISVVIEYGAGSYVPLNYTMGAGYQSNVYYTATNVYVGNVSGNSANILSKPYKLVITYEE